MDHLDKEVIESLSEPAKRVFKSLDYRSKQRILDGFFWNGKHQSCHVCVIKIHIGKRKTI